MVDLSFDCYKDARGKDPDSSSPTLRHLHSLLWSKPLPSGKVFHLDISPSVPRPFLHHKSELGEFYLTSDSITHSYRGRKTIKPYLSDLPAHLLEAVNSWPWIVPECIVFPGKKIDGKTTINGARGMNSKIDDRFDLTLECIRLHYLGEQNPLEVVLNRYGAFFALFESFKGYVEFFLLQDIVSEDLMEVKFYLPFDNFVSNPLPSTLEAYVNYLKRMHAFGVSRAERMNRWCEANLRPHNEW